jgi:hypothetical protein
MRDNLDAILFNAREEGDTMRCLCGRKLEDTGLICVCPTCGKISCECECEKVKV